MENYMILLCLVVPSIIPGTVTSGNTISTATATATEKPAINSTTGGTTVITLTEIITVKQTPTTTESLLPITDNDGMIRTSPKLTTSDGVADTTVNVTDIKTDEIIRTTLVQHIVTAAETEIYTTATDIVTEWQTTEGKTDIPESSLSETEEYSPTTQPAAGSSTEIFTEIITTRLGTTDLESSKVPITEEEVTVLSETEIRTIPPTPGTTIPDEGMDISTDIVTEIVTYDNVGLDTQTTPGTLLPENKTDNTPVIEEVTVLSQTDFSPILSTSSTAIPDEGIDITTDIATEIVTYVEDGFTSMIPAGNLLPESTTAEQDISVTETSLSETEISTILSMSSTVAPDTGMDTTTVIATEIVSNVEDGFTTMTLAERVLSEKTTVAEVVTVLSETETESTEIVTYVEDSLTTGSVLITAPIGTDITNPLKSEIVDVTTFVKITELDLTTQNASVVSLSEQVTVSSEINRTVVAMTSGLPTEGTTQLGLTTLISEIPTLTDQMFTKQNETTLPPNTYRTPTQSTETILSQTTSQTPTPSVLDQTTTRTPAASTLNIKDMTDEQKANNIISMEFKSIRVHDWMTTHDNTFRRFLMDNLHIQLNDIIYISPSPINEKEMLYLLFIIRSNHSTRKKRDANGNAYMDGGNILKMINNNMDELANQLNIPRENISVQIGVAPVIEKTATGESTNNRGSGPASPGLFIALIIVGSILVVIITVIFIYLVCDRRRSTRGEYITNAINKDLEFGLDNPALLQDKSIANRNGAHLLSIKIMDEPDQDIVPYDSFTQEEIMNCEVEDTHL